MARCCGGRNAGKPIPAARYALGLLVLLGYHGAVGTLLCVASRARPELRAVRDVHRDLLRVELGEVLARKGIRVRGWVRASRKEPGCEVVSPAKAEGERG